MGATKSQNTALAELLAATQNSQYGAAQSSNDLSLAMDSVKRQPTSKYDIFTQLPSFSNAIAKFAKTDELQNEARSLVPDEATFLNTILDKDIYSGHKDVYTKALQKLSTSYLNEYSKDPYFAFSKKARDMVKTMQQVAIDPRLTELEELKTKNEIIRKSAETKELWENPVVHDGKVLVERGKDKKFTKWVAPQNIKEDDFVLTVGDNYKLVQSNRKHTPMELDMEDYEDVMDKIMLSVDNLGTTEKTMLYGDSKVTGKSQKEQAAIRKKWLQSQGLSQADWNTLTSEYVKRYGIPKDKDQIFKWTIQEANKFIDSSLDDTDIVGADGLPVTEGGGGVNSTINTGLTGTANVGEVQLQLIGTKDPKNAISTDEAKNVLGTPAITEMAKNKVRLDIIQPVNGNIWHAPTSKIAEDVDISAGLRPLNDNVILNRIRAPESQITTIDNKQINEGDAIPDPYRDSFIVMEDGNPMMYIPVIYSEDLSMFISTPDVVQESNFMGKRDEGGNYTEESIGDTDENDNKSSLYRRVMKNVGTTGVGGEWSTDWIDDNVYEGMVKVQLSKDYDVQARLIDGQPMYIPKSSQAALRTVTNKQSTAQQQKKKTIHLHEL